MQHYVCKLIWTDGHLFSKFACLLWGTCVVPGVFVTCRKTRFRGNPFGVKILRRCSLWRPLVKHLFLKWAVVEECGPLRLEREEWFGYWFGSGCFLGFLFFFAWINKNLVGSGSCLSRSMFSRPCRTCLSWPLWYQTCSSCRAAPQWTRQHFELTRRVQPRITSFDSNRKRDELTHEKASLKSLGLMQRT